MEGPSSEIPTEVYSATPTPSASSPAALAEAAKVTFGASGAAAAAGCAPRQRSRSKALAQSAHDFEIDIQDPFPRGLELDGSEGGLLTSEPSPRAFPALASGRAIPRCEGHPRSQWRDRAGLAPDFPVHRSAIRFVAGNPADNPPPRRRSAAPPT